MEKSDEIRLKLTVSRLVRLGLLQSSALMNLSTAIMRIDGIPEESKAEAYEVFSGLQEQLNVLKEIQDAEYVDGV